MTAAWPIAAVVLVIWPSLLAAQRDGCERAYPSFGTRGFTYDGAASWPLRVEERRWTFTSPPAVGTVVEGGIGEGRLRSGDTILAIAGLPITSEAGGRRFAAMRPGEEVVLLVQNQGERRTVRLVPEFVCQDDESSLLRFAAPARLATTAGRGSAAHASAEALEAASASEAWFGFGLACDDCGWSREGPGRPVVWHAATRPIVRSVDPDGPASRAGIRVGDILVAVDGHDITSSAAGRLFGGARTGQSLSVALERNGRPLQVNLVVGSRPGGGGDSRGVVPRYMGTLGNVVVELLTHRASPAEVTVSDTLILIRTNDAVIRLRIARNAPR